MTDRQHEDHNLAIVDVVDDAVVTDANAHLPVATLELLATVWTGAHHCQATDYDAVWATLSVDLPRVRAAIASVLDN